MIILGLVVRDARFALRERRVAAVVPVRYDSAGVVRDVNMKKLETLIRRGRLSDREAMYYEPLSDPAGE